MACAPGYRVETIDKAVKLTRELGLYYLMTIGNAPGTFNEKWAEDWFGKEKDAVAIDSFRTGVVKFKQQMS